MLEIAGGQVGDGQPRSCVLQPLAEVAGLGRRWFGSKAVEAEDRSHFCGAGGGGGVSGTSVNLISASALNSLKGS